MKNLRFLVSCVFLSGIAGAQTPTFDGCQVFPANDVWNTRIDNLPVDPKSTTYIDNIGISSPLHAAFSSRYGYPLTTVTGSHAKVNVAFRYESDPGPYPIPPNIAIQEEADAHALIVDTTNCVLYELFALGKGSDGSWHAGSGAIFHLNSNALRPDGWTSADAAGLPMFPGSLRYDEVMTGHVNHALRFTAPHSRNKYIWPARHYASYLSGSQYPEFGMRLRLKSDFDISSFSPRMQTILQALKTYGMFFADNGLPWDVCGLKDPRWDSNELAQFTRLVGADFEVVNESSLMVNINSGEAAVKSSSSALRVGWVNIISKASGKCLSIVGGPAATSSGNLTDQSTCVGGTNQEFQLTQVYRGPTGLNNGAPIVQAYFNGYPNEVWTVTANSDGTYTIMPKSSGKCMTVEGATTQDGTPIQQWTCTGGTNQEWTLEPAS
jgi:ricin-type beta-trefoil lectin protein